MKYKRNTAQKTKFSIKDFFSKCDQIHRKLRVWSHLQIKSLMENFMFCAVKTIENAEKETKTLYTNQQLKKMADNFQIFFNCRS